ncbi:lachesin-like [Tachypleus tridentatus]|uniref:lachesin-like n=1 Tax=Tachypleus tridentatus TaxID=6853 RepID=UPI003FD0F2BE
MVIRLLQTKDCVTTEFGFDKKTESGSSIKIPANSSGSKEAEVEPDFTEPIPNVTVSVGRDVKLACVVENLGSYRIAWIHTDRYTLLTLQNRVITRNPRFSITHNGHRTWTLHIREVEERDSGEYMCQINTSPMKSQSGFISVVVPPRIDEGNTSTDLEVKENEEVTLKCVATGSPEPTITWRREDSLPISIGSKKVPSVVGSNLSILKVNRHHIGAYLCIASNGVQPSVSKRIVLGVAFQPTIAVPNQVVGAAIGSDVTLDCNLESHPKSVAYWIREKDVYIVISNTKYNTSETPSGPYKTHMKLQIRNLQPDDLGTYRCSAKNSLGFADGTIKLYEIPAPVTSPQPYLPDTLQPKSEKLWNSYSHNVVSKPNEKDISTDVIDDTHDVVHPDIIRLLLQKITRLFLKKVHTTTRRRLFRCHEHLWL